MALMRPLSVVCLGLLYMLTGCSKEEVPETLPRVGVQQVQPTDFAARVTLTGDVQARVQTDLSFRVGGKIISRSVDVGDHVKANQVLARLDPKDLQNNVDSAKAEVFAAQARVTQTSAAFVRQQKLLPKGYTSQSEYDAAEAALRSNQSALKAAQAQLANANEQLSYTALVSEAAGVITERQAEVGQVVQATMPIFSLATDGDRDAVFNVYESLLVAPPQRCRGDRQPTGRPQGPGPWLRARNHPDGVGAKRHGAGQGRPERRACRYATGCTGDRHHQCPGPAQHRTAVVGADQGPA